MDIFNTYLVAVRIALILCTIYHVYKKQYKFAGSAAIVFALTYLPWVLDWLFGFSMDLVGNMLYVVVIMMTMYLGSTLKFYDRYSWWDRLIHFLSGVMFVSFGIAVAEYAGVFNRLHVLLFSLTLSVTLHVIWEIAEYTFDTIFRGNSQSWQAITPANNHKPATAIQPAGLVDTMDDTIMCSIGTLTACGVWWLIL